MTLGELADLFNADLIITRHANQKGRCTAYLKGVYVKGHEREDIKGEHLSPEVAIDDYVHKIRGKCLVLNPFDRNRMEFKGPETLDYLKTEKNKDLVEVLP